SALRGRLRWHACPAHRRAEPRPPIDCSFGETSQPLQTRPAADKNRQVAQRECCVHRSPGRFPATPRDDLYRCHDEIDEKPSQKMERRRSRPNGCPVVRGTIDNGVCNPAPEKPSQEIAETRSLGWDPVPYPQLRPVFAPVTRGDRALRKIVIFAAQQGAPFLAEVRREAPQFFEQRSSQGHVRADRRMADKRLRLNVAQES